MTYNFSIHIIISRYPPNVFPILDACYFTKFIKTNKNMKTVARRRIKREEGSPVHGEEAHTNNIILPSIHRLKTQHQYSTGRASHDRRPAPSPLPLSLLLPLFSHSPRSPNPILPGVLRSLLAECGCCVGEGIRENSAAASPDPRRSCLSSLLFLASDHISV
jgi:hypothetical protein